MILLSKEEAALLIDAIDSHLYWQLSDRHYRADAQVLEPGSDDADTAAEIKVYLELQEKLAASARCG